VITLGYLLLAVGVLAGWPRNVAVANLLAGALVFIGVVAFLGLALAMHSKEVNRRWLAGVVEDGQPKLLDRVHTLVALAPKRQQPALEPFYRRIAWQAQQLLLREPPAIKVSFRRAVVHFAAFLVLLAVTMEVYDRFTPWQRLRAAELSRQAAQAPPQEPTLELPPPEKAVEQRLPWGEVRIVEPGRDLQVTKMDTVALQIEAAANEPLQQVVWFSAVNGGAERQHDLPAPADPRFAVYQPSIELPAWNLAEWDVVSYYAKAATRTTNSYASEVFFLEVRPFREDLDQLPGGANGLAMQCLDEISALIGQQQHLIRQTHRHVQSPHLSAQLQEQDRLKLAEAETDLRQAVRHLHARMVVELANKPILESLEHLAEAEKAAGQAGDSLRADLLKEAQASERSALAGLVAARRTFSAAVRAHPDDFAQPRDQDLELAQDTKDLLKKIAEFRNEAKAATDFLQELAQKQRALADRANSAPTATYQQMAREEKDIQKSLTGFQQENPQIFESTQAEARTAEQSLDQAAQALTKRAADTRAKVRTAADQLEKLSEAVQRSAADRQLADAYKLKRMLDQQIGTLGQCENPGPGGGPSPAELQQAANDSRQVLRQLKQVAEQPPTSTAFGPQLRESLSTANLNRLNQSLAELERPQEAEARQQAAGRARRGLENVSQAFEQSQPQALRAARDHPRPGASPSEADFWRSLGQLENLLRALESKRPGAQADQAKQGREALANLRQAMPDKGGNNERGNQILLALEQEFQKKDAPLDLELLKRLLDQLQAFSGEVFTKTDTAEEQPKVTELDPTRLPPAYRGRIEKYFQKLSER
jgi:hypothetical protein